VSTISTDRLEATLVAGAMAYTPRGGVPLSAGITKMYRYSAAANAVYPYAVFSLRSPKLAPGDNSLKLLYDFEGFIWNRPRSTQAATQNLGDTWAAYLTTLRDATSGLLYCTDVRAESLPQMSSPADANIVQVLVRATLNVWPTFLSSLYP
jgi:hypothetical protein